MSTSSVASASFAFRPPSCWPKRPRPLASSWTLEPGMAASSIAWRGLTPIGSASQWMPAAMRCGGYRGEPSARPAAADFQRSVRPRSGRLASASTDRDRRRGDRELSLGQSSASDRSAGPRGAQAHRRSGAARGCATDSRQRVRARCGADQSEQPSTACLPLLRHAYLESGVALVSCGRSLTEGDRSTLSWAADAGVVLAIDGIVAGRRASRMLSDVAKLH